MRDGLKDELEIRNPKFNQETGWLARQGYTCGQAKCMIKRDTTGDVMKVMYILQKTGTWCSYSGISNLKYVKNGTKHF